MLKIYDWWQMILILDSSHEDYSYEISSFGKVKISRGENILLTSYEQVAGSPSKNGIPPRKVEDITRVILLCKSDINITKKEFESVKKKKFYDKCVYDITPVNPEKYDELITNLELLYWSDFGVSQRELEDTDSTKEFPNLNLSPLKARIGDEPVLYSKEILTTPLIKILKKVKNTEGVLTAYLKPNPNGWYGKDIFYIGNKNEYFKFRADFLKSLVTPATASTEFMSGIFASIESTSGSEMSVSAGEDSVLRHYQDVINNKTKKIVLKSENKYLTRKFINGLKKDLGGLFIFDCLKEEGSYPVSRPNAAGIIIVNIDSLPVPRIRKLHHELSSGIYKDKLTVVLSGEKHVKEEFADYSLLQLPDDESLRMNFGRVFFYLLKEKGLILQEDSSSYLDIPRLLMNKEVMDLLKRIYSLEKMESLVDELKYFRISEYHLGDHAFWYELKDFIEKSYSMPGESSYSQEKIENDSFDPLQNESSGSFGIGAASHSAISHGLMEVNSNEGDFETLSYIFYHYSDPEKVKSEQWMIFSKEPDKKPSVLIKAPYNNSLGIKYMAYLAKYCTAPKYIDPEELYKIVQEWHGKAGSKKSKGDKDSFYFNSKEMKRSHSLNKNARGQIGNTSLDLAIKDIGAAISYEFSNKKLKTEENIPKLKILKDCFKNTKQGSYFLEPRGISIIVKDPKLPPASTSIKDRRAE